MENPRTFLGDEGRCRAEVFVRQEDGPASDHEVNVYGKCVEENEEPGCAQSCECEIRRRNQPDLISRGFDRHGSPVVVRDSSE